MSKIKMLGLAAGIVLGLFVGNIDPPVGLSVQAMQGMAIIICAVVWLIFNVTDDYVIIIAMSISFPLFKVVSFKVAFAIFSDPNWWLLVGALGLGVAVSKSGLLKRLSLYIMKMFPATFKGQVLAMIVSGTIIAPMIPSTTAKAAIVAPLARGISEAMGYEAKSESTAGIFGAFYTGFITTGPIFLSASFIGYACLGLLPLEDKAYFDWNHWLMATLPWAIVMLIGCTLGLLKLYKPANEKSLSGDYVKEQLALLGPVSFNEKLTMLVLGIALIFWMTERIHGINAAIIAMIGVCILLAAKIYGRPDFRAGMGWDNTIFIGGIMSIGTILATTQVDKWIGKILGPTIIPLMANPYVFIVSFVWIFYLTRFVIVSWVASITIFSLLLVPFAVSAGISPWIIVFTAFASVNSWLVFYQTSPFLTAFYAASTPDGGDMVTHKQMIKFSVVNMILNTVGLLISIPYWKMLGLIR